MAPVALIALLLLGDCGGSSGSGGDSATRTAIPPPPAAPSPISGDEEPLFSLAVWDGAAWQFSPSPQGATYSEGEAVPFLLRIDGARPGDNYPVTIRYDCNAFDFLTAYDRDHGSGPALAADGPGSAIADSGLAIPDDPGTAEDDAEAGALRLWGGSFAALGGPLPPSACADEKRLVPMLSAAADTLFLLWAAQLSEGASEGAIPLRLTVQVPDREELRIDIDPETVSPAPP